MKGLPMRRRALAAGLVLAALAAGRAAEPKFLSDDPLAREPETADASAAEPWDINLFYDLGYNLFVTSRREVASSRVEIVGCR